MLSHESTLHNTDNFFMFQLVVATVKNQIFGTNQDEVLTGNNTPMWVIEIRLHFRSLPSSIKNPITPLN
jgi:hypothetical protein